jgi:hypothetical protein
VPAMYGTIQAAHSARASERTTGIVSCSGDSGSYTVTIYKENALHLSIRLHDLASATLQNTSSNPRGERVLLHKLPPSA